MYVIIDNINSRIQLFSSCIPFPFLHVFYIIFELYYYNSQSLDSFAFFFLLKTTFSLAKRIYWRDGVSWNNRGNRSSTRFTFPAAFNRGGKKDRRGSKSPEVSRGNKNGNRSLISATAEPLPLFFFTPSSPLQVFPDTEGRSLVWMHHESETGCKYKTKAGGSASTLRPGCALGMAPSLDFPMPCINWYASAGDGTVKPRFPF